MKKFILFLICAVTAVSLCSCSDFGFNPTGHWKFVSDTLYADGKEIDATLAEDNRFLDDMFIIFEKSGTGYLRSSGEKLELFNYSYDNDTITVTYLPNEHHKEVTVQFKPSQDGKTIVRYTHDKENGIDYREENLYKKIF